MDNDTRERILNAAGKLFGELGYSRTSTRAIAAEAGVNEVTLFRHFGSKTNLLKAFVAHFNEGGFAATFTDRLTGDYRADIESMARLLLVTSTSAFRMLRLMVCDAFELPELRSIAMEGARGNHALMTAYFQNQIDTGIVRADLSPDALVYGFNGLFSTSLFFQFVFDAELSPDVVPEEMLHQLVELFVEGTRQR